MDLRVKKWSTADVPYAIKKYVCLLDLALPEGTTYEDGELTALKTIGIGLITRDIDNSYWRPVDDAYATIGVSTNCGTMLVPTSIGTIKVGCGRNLTHDQVNALLPLCTCATVLERYSGNDPALDPQLQCSIGDWDMSKVVSALHKMGKVTVRYTEHESRGDVRDLTWIEGYSLGRAHSVEDLRSEDGIGKYLIGMLA